ncbi:MAG TPA: hypothetical protein VFV81_03410, partial [Verrucomicrobiae bacterium]|nr:hypothetical protein [Verrucomicrobiae bacterium]
MPTAVASPAEITHGETVRPPVPPDGHPGKDIDWQGLKMDLEKALVGEVRVDRGSIGLYATDSSNFRE